MKSQDKTKTAIYVVNKKDKLIFESNKKQSTINFPLNLSPLRRRVKKNEKSKSEPGKPANNLVVNLYRTNRKNTEITKSPAKRKSSTAELKNQESTNKKT